MSSQSGAPCAPIFGTRLLTQTPSVWLRATHQIGRPQGWLARIEAGVGTYAGPADTSAAAMTALTSMFPIWLEDAQPGQTRYQKKLISPTNLTRTLRVVAGSRKNNAGSRRLSPCRVEVRADDPPDRHGPLRRHNVLHG